MKIRFFPSTLALCCSFASLSCTEEKVRTYKVAVDEEAEASTTAAPTADASKAPEPTVTGSLRWKALEGWEEGTPGQFQKAIYTLGPATTVSVSSLPGKAGGEAANVNRWRRQVGLEPVEDVGGETLAVEGGGISARWFDLRGPTSGILAAVISLADETWFFKLNAPASEIDARSEEFKSFLTTIGVPTAQAAPAPATTPPPTKAPAPAPAKAGIALDVPEGWEKSEGSSMRVASFRIPSKGGVEGGDGDVSIIPLPGQAGTDLENVNRWRGQLQLPPLEADTDAALGTHMDGKAGKFLITHMVSTEPLFDGDKPGAISTAILKVGTTTWFFKLIGEAELVAANREKFQAFVLSAELP